MEQSVAALAVAIALLVIGFEVSGAESSRLHVRAIKTPAELKEFLSHVKQSAPLVTAHRGGPRAGFPENAIATFENTLRHTWAMMEVDPRFTKDGEVVLFHDPVLDRTSTGSGKVSEHTYEQLKALRLKDPDGHVTAHAIPTLGEALAWARGKTILFLDDKGVSIEDRVASIQKHAAQSHAIIMVYNLADARRCYELDPSIMMEVFVPDRKALARFNETGVPWENVVAFVSHQAPRDPEIFRLINRKGTLAIIGTSRTLDRQYQAGEINAEELAHGYRETVRSGANILEADLAIEAGLALRKLVSVDR